MIEDILIENYKKETRTTRFDFTFIRKISADLIKIENFDDVKHEQLFSSWLTHFANRKENMQIRRFIVHKKTFIGKLAEWKIFLTYFL